MYLGRRKYKRKFVGLLFGRMGLNNLMKDDAPLRRNAPTNALFKIKEKQGEVNGEKKKWIS
jgi:hypothetical protein